MSRQRLSMVLMAAAVCGCQSASAQSSDPPSRIGRVSDVTGSVSLLPSGETNWSSASLNYPLTTGDALWADADARAEIHVGSSAIHIAPGTSLAFDAIQDNLIQLRIAQGAVQIRLRELSQDDSYEIDTPAGAILLHMAGDYRIDVTPDGQRTTVTVRDGEADVMIGNDSYPLRQGTSVTLTGPGAQPIENGSAMMPDAWENWADARDRRDDAVTSTRYVSREMVGYEDLDQYGDWQVDASYGPVWYPRSVSSDWAPYRTGRWEYLQPWGWTWIDEAPWGFAPFHYGRWSNQGGRWGWFPGSERSRPIYAPALVAFVSGDGWSASLSFGAGGGVGWVPLGPNEVYVPAYRSSPTYVRNVNITNVNVTNIDVTHVDINRVQYVNRNVPGAVTAVPRDAFIGSRPVGRAAVRVRPEDLRTARASAAPVAAGVPVAPPPRGSPLDRARPGNVGLVRQPPVALPRSPNPPRGASGRGNQATRVTPPPAVPTPPQAQDQGRGRANRQPPVAPERVTPTPVVPTPPQAQDQGRGRANRQPPVAPERVTPTPVVPPRVVPTPPQAQDQGRGRANRQPPVAPTRVTPTPVVPTPPPAQDQGRGRANRQPPVTPARQPVPMPVVPRAQPAPTPAAPTPATPSTQPGRGRNQPAQPAAKPATPPGRGRAAPPDTSRGRKPVKTRPDSGSGGGGPAIQVEYRR